MVERDKVYKRSIKSSSPYLTDELSKLKKLVKKNILHDSKNEFNQKVDELHMWGALDKLYPLVKPKPDIKMDVNDVNNFFAAISTRSANDILPNLPIKPQLPWDDRDLHFKFQPINDEIIRKAWITTKNRNSTAPDNFGFCNKMLNICMPSIHYRKQFANLFNIFINSGVLPKSLKLSKVIPIPKKCIPLTPNDLRPISLQPVIAKLFGKCLFDQLYLYFESNNLISMYQFGFRKYHSTTHALLAITEYMYEALDKNKFCVIIGIDLLKAFDKSCKDVLLHKLKWYGVDEVIINSFLSDREQYVCIKCNGCFNNSDVLPTNVGYPQGLCLSCFLFLVLMNDFM
jgi:hypothetical protein